MKYLFKRQKSFECYVSLIPRLQTGVNCFKKRTRAGYGKYQVLEMLTRRAVAQTVRSLWVVGGDRVGHAI